MGWKGCETGTDLQKGKKQVKELIFVLIIHVTNLGVIPMA